MVIWASKMAGALVFADHGEWRRETTFGFAEIHGSKSS